MRELFNDFRLVLVGLFTLGGYYALVALVPLLLLLMVTLVLAITRLW